MIETCGGCLKRDYRGFIGSDLLKYLSSRSRINASFSEQRLVALATAVLTKRCSPSCDFLNLDVAPYNIFELFAFIKIAQS